jgi:hypothetical protein
MGGALSRSRLLRRGAASAALACGGLAGFALPAAAASVPDADLAYLRLLLGAELLKVDFASRAVARRSLRPSTTALIRRIRADDEAHYSGLAALVGEAGQTPTTAGDIDFSYPRGSFDSEGEVLRLAWRLATVTLGAYLGAVENVQTPRLRLPLGQIAANEAQQLSALAPALGRPVIGRPYLASLPIGAVSSALDEFES